MTKMSKDKKRKRIYDDDEKCEIISASIFKMIASSDNEDFIKDCHRILQAKNRNQVKNKLKNKFMEVIANRKSEVSSQSSSQELDDPVDSLLESTGNFFPYEDELEGFADWEKL
ncbi:uncharacterized protein LOC135832451 [Planococcus citri]|uniref:uncharacterized protein LOC135832451 n=1 Tax=Planococcus citri TaxID=170843 RepID=UPI0031FA105C